MYRAGRTGTEKEEIRKEEFPLAGKTRKTTF